MIVSGSGNIVTIELNEDEVETFNFIGTPLFTQVIQDLFKNRKSQQEQNLRDQLVAGMSRAQLQEELRKRNG